MEPNNVLSPTTMDENEELSLHALLSFGRQITLGMVSYLKCLRNGFSLTLEDCSFGKYLSLIYRNICHNIISFMVI